MEQGKSFGPARRRSKTHSITFRKRATEFIICLQQQLQLAVFINSQSSDERTMVCDVTIASTVVSLMMNGICCYYQNEQQETMRRELRTEYQHILYQQQFGSAVVSPKCSVGLDHTNSSQTMTTLDQPTEVNTNKNHQSMEEQHHRRRKLLLDKANAWNHSLDSNQYSSLEKEEEATECSSCPTLITPEARSSGSSSSNRRATRGWGIRHVNRHSSATHEVSMSSIPDQPSNDSFAVSLNPNQYGDTEGIEMELMETSISDDDAPFENILL